MCILPRSAPSNVSETCDGSRRTYERQAGCAVVQWGGVQENPLATSRLTLVNARQPRSSTTTCAWWQIRACWLQDASSGRSLTAYITFCRSGQIRSQRSCS
jgi:hypothetical protein